MLCEGLPRQHRIFTPAHCAVLDGLRYAITDPWTRPLLIVAACLAFFAQSYAQLIPAFADSLAAGPRGYGRIMFWVGAGTLVGALSVSYLREIARKGRLMLVAGGMQSVAILFFATSSSLCEVMFALFVAAVGRAVANAMIGTKIQTAVPVEMRGRVMATYWAIFTGLPLFWCVRSRSIG